MVLSAFAVDYLFIQPIGSLSVATSSQRIALGVFLVTGSVLCTLAERLRRARSAKGGRRTNGAVARHHVGDR